MKNSIPTSTEEEAEGVHKRTRKWQRRKSLPLAGISPQPSSPETQSLK